MSIKNQVLVVDDDRAHRIMLRTLLHEWKHDVHEADDGSTAIQLVQEKPFDLVLMDIRMLKVSGLEALLQIKSFNPAIPVIIMTAYSSVETAIEALKNGAYDYLTKPLDFDKLRIIMDRAMEHVRLKAENLLLKETIKNQFDTQNIIGQSPGMVKLLTIASQAAPSDATVLITGESGTGKELIAGVIHYNSPRKDGPFIKINCAAITETLIESELFGHEKGAFTGAFRTKEGRILQANGGSIFLDEISEMPATMQVKLLRVLQERELTRVGGEKVLSFDVRVIAATNKSLPDLIGKGVFREDLYYRLNVIGLDVPPLRKRQEDIPILAHHFLEMFMKKNNKNIKGFTPKFMDTLLRYDWPGNVRELMNVIERSVVLAQSQYLDDEFTPIISTQQKTEEAQPIQNMANKPLEDVEKSAILSTLEDANGNKSETARRLGITRKTLHKKLKHYGIMK